MSQSRKDDSFDDEDWDKEIADEEAAALKTTETTAQEDELEEDWDADIANEEAATLQTKIKADEAEEEDWDLDEPATDQEKKLGGLKNLLDEDDMDASVEEEDKYKVEESSEAKNPFAVSVTLFEGTRNTFTNPNLNKNGFLALGADTLLTAAYSSGQADLINQAHSVLNNLNNKFEIETKKEDYQKTLARTIAMFTNKNDSGQLIFNKANYDPNLANALLELAAKTENTDSMDLARSVLLSREYKLDANERVSKILQDAQNIQNQKNGFLVEAGLDPVIVAAYNNGMKFSNADYQRMVIAITDKLDKNKGEVNPSLPARLMEIANKAGDADSKKLATSSLKSKGHEVTAPQQKVKGTIHDPSKGMQDNFDPLANAVQSYTNALKVNEENENTQVKKLGTKSR